MTAPAAALDVLRRRRPEWSPWLAVVEEVIRETTSAVWDAAVPAAPAAGRSLEPLLSGATALLPSKPVRNLFRRLTRIAAQSGTPKMATLGSAVRADLDVPALFAASIAQDGPRIAEVASVSWVDPEALEAVAALLPVPFLQACNRRWSSSISAGWVEPYCPVCASWPAFAEVRGIERSRHFRCGRCGSEWHARPLSCPYCANDDHESLASLVPGSGASNGVVDACTVCLGYVKALTRLQGCAAAAVALEDLATVDLDVAAVEQGYQRPAGAARPFSLSIVEDGARRRLFAWNGS